MKDFLACRADAVALEETDQALTQCLGRNSEQSAVVLLGLGADRLFHAYPVDYDDGVYPLV